MLKTTITKNSKACILAFLPRVLRGDIRYAPSKYQQLSLNAQRILEKSTKSGSSNHDDICEKCRRLIELSFGPNNDSSKTTDQGLKKPDTRDILNPVQDVHHKYNMNQNFNPYIDAKDEAHCNKRSSIGEEDFNKQEHSEKQADEGKLEQAIERGDEKSNGIKKPYNEDFHEAPKILNTRNTIKEHFVTNFEKTPTSHSIGKARRYESSPTESEIFLKYWDQPVPNAHLEHNEYNNQLYKKADSTIVLPENDRVKATTAKQKEEKLTQRLERIDEIPIVEAPNMKVEGFNVNPKVLDKKRTKTRVYSHNDNSTRKSGSKQYDDPLKLDELAKSCLNAPHKEIDDRLLKEMEKLAVPQTGHKVTDAPLMENELIQMDVLKKPKKPVKKADIDVELRKYEKDPAECIDIHKLYPTYMSQSPEKLQEKGDEGNSRPHQNQIELMSSHRNNENTSEVEAVIKPVLQDKVKPNFDPNQIQIDPYSKKITDEEYNDPNKTLIQTNSAITQAMPLVPLNVDEYKKTLDFIPVPHLKQNDDEDQKSSDLAANARSTYDNAEQEQSKKSNTYTTTETIESTHDNIAPIGANFSIPEKEHAPKFSTATLDAPKRMLIEPPLNHFSHEPSPTEKQLKHNRADNKQTISGQHVSHSFPRLQQADQKENPKLNKQSMKGAESTVPTPTESLRFKPSGHSLTSKAEPSKFNGQTNCPQANSNQEISHHFLQPEQTGHQQFNEQTLKGALSTAAATVEPPSFEPTKPSGLYGKDLTLNAEESKCNDQANSNHQISQPEQTVQPEVNEQTLKEAVSTGAPPVESPRFDSSGQFVTSKAEPSKFNDQQNYPQTNTNQQMPHNFVQPEQIVNPHPHEQTLNGMVTTAATPVVSPRFDQSEQFVTSKTEQSESKDQANLNQQISHNFVQPEQTVHPELNEQTLKGAVTTATTPVVSPRFEPNDQFLTSNVEPTYCPQASNDFVRPESMVNPQINEQTITGAMSTATTTVESPKFNSAEQPGVHGECLISREQPSEDRANLNQQITHNFVQAEQVANPLINKETLKEPAQQFNKNLTASMPLPNLDLDRNMPLTELLRRVRYRNRVEFCKSYTLNSQAPEVDPIVGKCGAKKPPCPPPAPICQPPPPPPPPQCPPPPPKCPQPCKPKCPPPCAPPKDPCAKFKNIGFGTNIRALLTLIFTPTPSQMKYAAMLFNYRQLPSEGEATYSNNAVLTDSVVESLQSVGKILVSVQHQDRIQALETEIMQFEGGSSGISYARDFDPWIPIPSWPIEKKEEKKPFICPKDGCKQLPPPPRNPPCDEKPCTSFPKRIFSPIDLFSAREDDDKVYDYREF